MTQINYGINSTLASAVYAVAASHPSLEDIPDLDGWTVLDIGDYSGAGWVVRGDAFGRLSFYTMYA